MKKLILAAGLSAVCAAAWAQDAPNQTQATQALQNAMQREIQAMDGAPAESRGSFDGQAASNVVRSLQVKSVNNCQDAGDQSVVCDVQTSATVRGTQQEKTNRYRFFRQGGKWEAAVAS